MGPKRHGPDGTGELFLAGEIKGATGFAARKDELLCRWQLVYDPSKSWQVLAGLQQVRKEAAWGAGPLSHRSAITAGPSSNQRGPFRAARQMGPCGNKQSDITNWRHA